jgi:hypothetical protein
MPTCVEGMMVLAKEAWVYRQDVQSPCVNLIKFGTAWPLIDSRQWRRQELKYCKKAVPMPEFVGL